MSAPATSLTVNPRRIHAYFHTHWDREWYQPFRVYQHRLLTVVDEILAAVESGDLPCFTLDGQTVVLEDYLALRPENLTRLEALVKTDKISIGPWYVMPDLFLIGGESVIRNLQRGLAISERFGETTYTGYLPDTFGHTADMPMIFRELGIDTAVVWRGVPKAFPYFSWASPDGSSVTALHLSEGYFQNAFHMMPSDEQKPFIDNWLNTLGSLCPDDDTPVLLPVGADHLGIVPSSHKTLSQWYPGYQPETMDQFMAGVQRQVSPDRTLTGELHDNTAAYVLPGVFSSRLYLKQSNRELEWRLSRQLEPLLTWCRLADQPIEASTQLDLLWQQLMLNHPHDSICGCSVDSVHRENEDRFAQVDQLSSALCHQAHETLRKAHFSDGSPWAVNLGSEPYTGVLSITADYPCHTAPPEVSPHQQVLSEVRMLDEAYLNNVRELPLSENQAIRRESLVWVEALPPNGVSSLTLGTPCPDTVTTGENTLSNAHLSINIAVDGSLNVLDKATGKTYKGLHHLTRQNEQGDSYNAAPIPEGESGSLKEEAELVRVIPGLSGPLRGSFTLVYQFKSIAMLLETDVSLDAGSKRLTFTTRFTNTTPDHKIQAVFITDSPIESVLAEGHFSPVIRHYDPDYRIKAAMPAPKGKELKVNAGAIQRFITTGGQTWITRGLTEYEVEGNRLKLTLLRAFGMLSRDDTGVRGSHAGPPLPTPEGQCLNRPAELIYAWYPGDDLKTAYQQADVFYGAVYGFEHTTPSAQPKHSSMSHYSWDNPSLRLSAVQPTPAGYDLRLYNPTGVEQSAQLSFPPGVRSWQPVTLAGKPSDYRKDDSLLVRPYGLQTVRVTLE